MKLVILMFLAADRECVERLLSEQAVPVFTRLPVEGVAPGPAGGWYATSAPYRSGLIMTVLEEGDARQLLEAVAGCRGIKDPKHPIRAMQLDVESMTVCECSP